jgi:hypothetical protein
MNILLKFMLIFLFKVALAAGFGFVILALL